MGVIDIMCGMNSRYCWDASVIVGYIDHVGVGGFMSLDASWLIGKGGIVWYCV